MEWTPSDKMTVTDLRAVLASWDVPSISNDKTLLANEVGRIYRQIMQSRSSRRPAVPSFLAGLPVFNPDAARSSAAARSSNDDKSIGTDCPHTEHSYIGSDEAPREDEAPPEDNLKDLDLSLIRLFEASCVAQGKMREQAEHSAACAAALAELPKEVPAELPKETPTESAAAAPEETPIESASCAAAAEPDELSRPVVRSTGLRRALEMEEEATAKAKADKAKAKAKKAAKGNDKLLYGYLPMAGVFIDEDMKKGNDQDNLDA